MNVKFIKKLAVIFLIIISALLLTACKEELTLDPYVSELRKDVYSGSSSNYTLKAGYGFKETPYSTDGSANQKVWLLTFKLVDKETDGATYTLSCSLIGTEYNTTFKLSPVSHALTAAIEIENFNEKQFTVNISVGGNSESVTMTSTLPEQTIDSSTALKHLWEKQPELINSYFIDGTFNGEIHERVLVKDDKPYYYIGLYSKDKNLKALLIDGLNGDVLAIREVI